MSKSEWRARLYGKPERVCLRGKPERLSSYSPGQRLGWYASTHLAPCKGIIGIYPLCLFWAQWRIENPYTKFRRITNPPGRGYG